MAKLPERVVSKEGKNRLGSQLTGQNRRSRDYPVPVLPGAREGRGSLELVEIFHKRCDVDVEPAGSRRRDNPPPPHPTPLTVIGPEDRRVGQSEGG